MNSQVLPNLSNQQNGDSYRMFVLPCHDIVKSGQPYGVASQSHPDSKLSYAKATYLVSSAWTSDFNRNTVFENI